jgi:hypothetical protein
MSVNEERDDTMHEIKAYDHIKPEEKISVYSYTAHGTEPEHTQGAWKPYENVGTYYGYGAYRPGFPLDTHISWKLVVRHSKSARILHRNFGASPHAKTAGAYLLLGRRLF